MKREQPKCPECGSTDLRKDAYAEWDKDEQVWVLHSVYDDTACECGWHGNNPYWGEIDDAAPDTEV